MTANFSTPKSAHEIEAAKIRAQAFVTKRALLSAGSAFVPLPGVDMLVDATVLVKLIDDINREFGLTPSQIEALPTTQKLIVYEAINWAGTFLVGKLISTQIAVKLLTKVGLKVTSKQIARWIPLVGQATAAAVGFTALRYLANRHIEDCVRVSRRFVYLLENEKR